jgi:hypothetical protein
MGQPYSNKVSLISFNIHKMHSLSSQQRKIIKLFIISWLCFNNIPQEGEGNYLYLYKIKYLLILSAIDKTKSTVNIKQEFDDLFKQPEDISPILDEIKRYRPFYKKSNKILIKPLSTSTTLRDYYNYLQYLNRFEFFYKKNNRANSYNKIKIRIEAIKGLEITNYIYTNYK